MSCFTQLVNRSHQSSKNPIEYSLPVDMESTSNIVSLTTREIFTGNLMD